MSEDEYRKIMASSDGSRFKEVEILDPHVVPLTNDAALITYRARLNGKIMVDTSTWVHEGDAWVCAYHSEYPASSAEAAS